MPLRKVQAFPPGTQPEMSQTRSLLQSNLAQYPLDKQSKWQHRFQYYLGILQLLQVIRKMERDSLS